MAQDRRNTRRSMPGHHLRRSDHHPRPFLLYGFPGKAVIGEPSRTRMKRRVRRGTRYRSPGWAAGRSAATRPEHRAADSDASTCSCIGERRHVVLDADVWGRPPAKNSAGRFLEGRTSHGFFIASVRPIHRHPSPMPTSPRDDPQHTENSLKRLGIEHLQDLRNFTAADGATSAGQKPGLGRRPAGKKERSRGSERASNPWPRRNTAGSTRTARRCKSSSTSSAKRPRRAACSTAAEVDVASSVSCLGVWLTRGQVHAPRPISQSRGHRTINRNGEKFNVGGNVRRSQLEGLEMAEKLKPLAPTGYTLPQLAQQLPQSPRGEYDHQRAEPLTGTRQRRRRREHNRCWLTRTPSSASSS